jgi:hypothetical protein
MQFFADASTNSQPNSLAKAWPSCVDTSLSVTRSLLFPTSMMGTELAGTTGGADEPAYVDVAHDSFTRWIWW